MMTCGAGRQRQRHGEVTAAAFPRANLQEDLLPRSHGCSLAVPCARQWTALSRWSWVLFVKYLPSNGRSNRVVESPQERRRRFGWFWMKLPKCHEAVGMMCCGGRRSPGSSRLAGCCDERSEARDSSVGGGGGGRGGGGVGVGGWGGRRGGGGGRAGGGGGGAGPTTAARRGPNQR